MSITPAMLTLAKAQTEISSRDYRARRKWRHEDGPPNPILLPGDISHESRIRHFYSLFRNFASMSILANLTSLGRVGLKAACVTTPASTTAISHLHVFNHFGTSTSARMPISLSNQTPCNFAATSIVIRRTISPSIASISVATTPELAIPASAVNSTAPLTKLLLDLHVSLLQERRIITSDLVARDARVLFKASNLSVALARTRHSAWTLASTALPSPDYTPCSAPAPRKSLAVDDLVFDLEIELAVNRAEYAAWQAKYQALMRPPLNDKEY